MELKSFLMIVTCLVLNTASAENSTGNAESKLYNYLMTGYDEWNPDRALRPIASINETMNVHFGLALIQVMNYNEDTGAGKFLFWDRYYWNDAYLKWNPDDFDGINTLRVPIAKIWSPDVVLYNNPEPLQMDAHYYIAVISSDGSVLFIPPVKREITCSTHKKEVYCSFMFGSWTYDGFKINLDFFDGIEQVDLSDYVISNQLDLIHTEAKKNNKYYPCCAEPYPDLTFSLSFELAKD